MAGWFQNESFAFCCSEVCHCPFWAQTLNQCQPFQIDTLKLEHVRAQIIIGCNSFLTANNGVSIFDEFTPPAIRFVFTQTSGNIIFPLEIYFRSIYMSFDVDT